MGRVLFEREVRGYPPAVVDRFAGDPEAWLPQPVLLHGIHQFHVYLWVWTVGLLVDVRVGGAVHRDDDVARRLRLDLFASPAGWLVGTIEGDLVVTRGGEGATLRFDGVWGHSRSLLSALGLGHLLAAALARSMATEIADRLGHVAFPDAPSHVRPRRGASA